MSLHIKVNLFSHRQTKNQNLRNIFHTTDKIDTVLGEIMAVQKVMFRILSFQTTRA